MQPPIASPHAQPVVPVVYGRATWNQWIYAVSCLAFCSAIVYFAFDNTRAFTSSLFPRDCSTGLHSTFTEAPFYFCLCFIPALQLGVAAKKNWGRGPLRLMRFAATACFIITGALFVGMIVLNNVRNQLR